LNKIKIILLVFVGIFFLGFTAMAGSFKTDLPLILIPSSANVNLPLVVFISGDGGWTNFDQLLCEKLAKSGMPVVVLNSQKYFWTKKKPKQVADGLSTVAIHYMQEWKRNSFVLVGYSFGACVTPFVVNNFPSTLKPSLKGVFCMSPNETADFEIHISDMLSFNTKEKYDVLSELKKITFLKPVCIFGTDEDVDSRKHFQKIGVKVETLPGNHHYNDDYNAVAAIILKYFSRTN
jgi:type IV secretory pathway VirJ component